jgi:D-amino peptidase
VQVFISTDFEGISGVVDFTQIMPGKRDYERARGYFMHDINASVQGAVDGGATRVVVCDNHSFSLNAIYEELHDSAELVTGGAQSPGDPLVMRTLTDDFDVVLLVGYHAAAHYPGGVISHSYHLPTNFWEISINGMKVGETEIGAALAGYYGVPCGLVSGDDVTIEQARTFLPDAEMVVVKFAIDRTAARCLPLKTTAALIHDGAERAVRRAAAGEFEPWTFEPPITLQVTCGNFGLAGKLGLMPGSERLDSRVVAYRSDSYLDVYHALMTYSFLAITSTEPAGADGLVSRPIGSPARGTRQPGVRHRFLSRGPLRRNRDVSSTDTCRDRRVSNRRQREAI